MITLTVKEIQDIKFRQVMQSGNKGNVKWNEVFNDEKDMLETYKLLLRFKSFRDYVGENPWINMAKHNTELSEKQMRQLKRQSNILIDYVSFRISAVESFTQESKLLAFYKTLDSEKQQT